MPCRLQCGRRSCGDRDIPQSSRLALRRQSACRNEKPASRSTSSLLLDEAWRLPRIVVVRVGSATRLILGRIEQRSRRTSRFFSNRSRCFSSMECSEEEIAWHTFYWPMANYGWRARIILWELQRDEGYATWSDLPEAIRPLQEVEARESDRRFAQIAGTRAKRRIR
jgi:hypothetical protein